MYLTIAQENGGWHYPVLQFHTSDNSASRGSDGLTN
jgi:hypothetical protein